MSIAAVFLFGSMARGDDCDGSDTDLLLVELDGETRHVSAKPLSIFVYSWKQLISEAKNGDLFACHLVCEAKAVFDPKGYLTRLKKVFRYRSSYSDDIERATDFGWFLVNFGDELNAALLAKRTLWCVRTVLISRSVERHDPIFAPSTLSERTACPAARDLLARRHGKRDPTELRRHLRTFLTSETSVDPSVANADRDTLLLRFERTFNRVALQTLRQGAHDQADYL